MGWDYLKLGDAKRAEPYFQRAHKLAPQVSDLLLGYAYTELELKRYEVAASLLRVLRQRGVDDTDVHLAWATLYRQVGRNRDAAREFQVALALQKNNPTALKNLQEIYNLAGDVGQVSLEFQPLIRPKNLTYPARVDGEHFAWAVENAWKPVYVTGVDLTAALPGHFPADSPLDPSQYLDWFFQISDLGVNTVRVYTILPPAFYRALFQFNSSPTRTPLRLFQGVTMGDPPRSDLFNHSFTAGCQKEIRDTIDVIHGQGDVGATKVHPGGIYPNNIAHWVAGFILGPTWLSHVVVENNLLHPDPRSYQGNYIEVPSGNATEIFLAQMINYAADYEESRYNWQHPMGFASSPTFDPMRHPSESTMLEEVSIRRSLGERVTLPPDPVDDDDAVSLDPLHLRARPRFPSGYFVAYNVLPFYPDFINRQPAYQKARDDEGANPFFGYLKDLKAHHRGIPLLISEYGIPTSLGIGHFSAAGFNEGGLAGRQQGELLARFTRNIYDAGAAGGLIYEWLDQWFRQSWLVRAFESPPERRPLWTNFMDPNQHYGLIAADPRLFRHHLLSGETSEWQNKPPLYTRLSPRQYQPVGDRYDPARDLKELYADADEAFLYLRLVVGKLDNDKDGQPDWEEANYLIGIGTAPGLAGMTYLPFIAPVRFPMGMTYAIQLSGPEESRIWVASSYDPFQILPVEGLPTQTVLIPKLGWKPYLTENGSFEPEIMEPNRRRFGRDGKYFPPDRYDRGILRYGSLNPKAPDYDPLAEWHTNIQTNIIDLRIPWNLLNVTDPSMLQIFMGLQPDGAIQTKETPGFTLVAFSYRPSPGAKLRTIMEQGHPVADALPGMSGPATILSAGLKQYRWARWDTPAFTLRPKASYAVVREGLRSLSVSPPALLRLPQPMALGTRERNH